MKIGVYEVWHDLHWGGSAVKRMNALGKEGWEFFLITDEENPTRKQYWARKEVTPVSEPYDGQR